MKRQHENQYPQTNFNSIGSNTAPLSDLPLSNTVEPPIKKIKSSPDGSVSEPTQMKPNDVFTTKPSRQFFTGNQTVRKPVTASYIIDTISTVAELVKRVADRRKKDKIKLRFLVTTDYQLLFAEEGPAGDKIPAHYQMTGASSRNEAHCLTAGNITFENGMEVTKITHKSGDFHPTLNSLQWVLALLFVNKMQFNKQIIVGRQPEAGGQLLHVGVSELKAFIYNQFAKKDLKTMRKANENLELKKYEYASRQNEYTPSGQGFFQKKKRNVAATAPTYLENAGESFKVCK